MKRTLLTLSFFISVHASAQNLNHWIPAEKFQDNSDVPLNGSITDDGGKMVYLLTSNRDNNNHQIRIKIGKNENLTRWLSNPRNEKFEVCAMVANSEDGTNRIRVKHPDNSLGKIHTLNSIDYKFLCSRSGPLADRVVISGLAVLSQTVPLKIRGVSFRPIEGSGSTGNFSLLEGYEYSRALGYLWGDGKATEDGNFLFFLKRNTKTSNHFGSVAEAFFGDALTVNGNGGRYKVQLDGASPAEFLAEGMSLSDIPDTRAFLTSVVETEGGVITARLTDDPSRERCAFIKALVDDLNPRCAIDSESPNCAFIAHGSKRGTPDRPGINSHCGVYLSGEASDWRDLFSSDDYHFVKTDRTPGGEPTQNDPASRPAYTQE